MIHTLPLSSVCSCPWLILYSMLVLSWHCGLENEMHSGSGPSMYVCYAERILCGISPFVTVAFYDLMRHFKCLQSAMSLDFELTYCHILCSTVSSLTLYFIKMALVSKIYTVRTISNMGQYGSLHYGC